MARYKHRLPRAKKEIAKRKLLANDPTFVHLARCGDVYAASMRYGMSRRSLFRLAKLDPRAVRRFGNRSIWDFSVMDEIIDKLPLAAEPGCIQQDHITKARRMRAAKAEKAAAEPPAKAAAPSRAPHSARRSPP